MGKIQVIESLAIPKLVHLLMSLPGPDRGDYLADPVALKKILMQPLWENHFVGKKK